MRHGPEQFDKFYADYQEALAEHGTSTERTPEQIDALLTDLYERFTQSDDPDYHETFPVGPEAFKHLNDAQKERFYQIELDKFQVITSLHKELAQLDNRYYTPERTPSARELRYDTFGECFTLQGKELSVGTVYADLLWGVEYRLSSNAPRALREGYALARAHQRLFELADEQILISEIANPLTELGQKEAYQEIQRKREARETDTGWLAERMVESLFTQIAGDHQELGITVESANARQDVAHKIDFIIEIPAKPHVRGVGVEDPSEHPVDRIAVQFTTSRSSERLAHKAHQLERVHGEVLESGLDDIVLVQIPLDRVQRAYDTWRRAQRPPGGPGGSWDMDTKGEIFREVLSGIMEEGEIRSAWNTIHAAEASPLDAWTF